MYRYEQIPYICRDLADLVLNTRNVELPIGSWDHRDPLTRSCFHRGSCETSVSGLRGVRRGVEGIGGGNGNVVIAIAIDAVALRRIRIVIRTGKLGLSGIVYVQPIGIGTGHRAGFIQNLFVLV